MVLLVFGRGMQEYVTLIGVNDIMLRTKIRDRERY